MTVEVEPYENPSRCGCNHPKCDGRPARWRFPETNHRPQGPLVSCSVHLARLCELVLKYYIEEPHLNPQDGLRELSIRRPQAA